MIDRMGREIDNEESIYYWCHKNKIPVFCPAITDGSIGDMLYFKSYKRGGFILDIAGDIRRINDEALKAKASGMIILGGGVSKHHVCNANLMRNGANFSVFINTGQEFDGSDSGAQPDEAQSWGKIRFDAHPVKVYCDATLVFPLIVSQTFAKGGPKVPLKTKPKAAAAEQSA
jgi:deoxyhypusine synthase